MFMKIAIFDDKPRQRSHLELKHKENMKVWPKQGFTECLRVWWSRFDPWGVKGGGGGIVSEVFRATRCSSQIAGTNIRNGYRCNKGSWRVNQGATCDDHQIKCNQMVMDKGINQLVAADFWFTCLSPVVVYVKFYTSPLFVCYTVTQIWCAIQLSLEVWRLVFLVKFVT